VEPVLCGPVKIDSWVTKELERLGPDTERVEAAGFDGVWVGESEHDPFLQVLKIGEASDRLTVGTSVAIAFARTPMTLAYLGHDLARYSRGRFVLGLGSQVKAHIERRFSMPWSHPAPRMRELVMALRAIWSSWQDGTPLSFKGDFYTHTLMTPFFSPERHEWGAPPVYLAGVGALMTEVAGEVCDGFFFHPFTTLAYLREVTLPALARGSAKAARPAGAVTVCGPAFAVVGRNEEELDRSARAAKDQIAFYASTPAYRGVLDHHGWGALQPELSGLARHGRWAEMGPLIDDEMLRTFAVIGSPAEVGRGLRANFDGMVDRLVVYAMHDPGPEVWPEVVDAFRG
jgi:probable F420-dependent oxidoreductase